MFVQLDIIHDKLYAYFHILLNIYMNCVAFSYIPKLKWIAKDDADDDDDEKVLDYGSKLFPFLLVAGKGKLFLFNMTLCMFTKLAKTL